MNRSKLPLDRPFVWASQQLYNPSRIFYQDKKNPTDIQYYPTGKRGAGTKGYNSGLTALGSDSVLAPGWTAESAK